MELLKSWYLSIIQLGIDDSYSHFFKLRVKLMNQFNLVLILGSTFGTIIAVFNREPDFYNPLLLALLSTFVFYFVYLKKHNFARFYCTYIYPLFILYMIIFYGIELKIEFTYIAFVLLSVIVYDNNKLKLINILYILCLAIIGLFYNRYFESYLPGPVDIMYSLIIVSFTMYGCFLMFKIFFDESQIFYKNQANLIKELKTNNEKLSLLNEQNNTKRDLMTILAHDLKGPAASFKDLTKKLQYLIKQDDRERILEMSSYYESQGDSLFYYLDNLLNWVLSQREEIKPKIQSVNICELVNEVINYQITFSSKNNILIQNKLDPQKVIYTDRNILKIIFSNILNNAVKYSHTTGIVKVASVIKNGYYCITVQDFGAGISKEKIEVLTNSNMLQADTNIKSQGHGLGLKSCFFLVNKLKGKIIIESKLNEGSLVCILLPLDSETNPRQRQVQESSV